MSISVVTTYLYVETDDLGVYRNHARLAVTGLTTSANNSVPHGLTNYGARVAPLEVGIEPTSNNQFWEYQSPDSTNVYVGVGSGSGTTVQLYVTY